MNNFNKNKKFVSDAVKHFPDSISVGLDLLKEKVAIKVGRSIANKADYFSKISDLG